MTGQTEGGRISVGYAMNFRDMEHLIQGGSIHVRVSEEITIRIESTADFRCVLNPHYRSRCGKITGAVREIDTRPGHENSSIDE